MTALVRNQKGFTVYEMCNTANFETIGICVVDGKVPIQKVFCRGYSQLLDLELSIFTLHADSVEHEVKIKLQQ